MIGIKSSYCAIYRINERGVDFMNERLNIKNSNPSMQTILETIKDDIGIELAQEGLQINFKIEESKKLEIEIAWSDDGYVLTASKIPYLLNALTNVISHHRNSDKKLNRVYQAAFINNGLMVDCSRNAVMNKETVKSLLRKSAQLGHTWFSLYIEDTYEIDGEPYFGAYRGRYSKQDLKELDDYANQFGVELYPSIQTLAHVNQFLLWEHEESNYKDVDDIINVGRQKTKQLLEKMIQTLSECFRTNRIHLGMDEAYNLGRGSYLSEFGYKEKSEIMLEHLNYLVDICKKYQVKPMIWDDMFFSNYSNVEGKATFNIPENIDLMYWDYYNLNQGHYSKRIKMRREIAKEVMFAGGAWRWTGYAPHHQKTLLTTIAALNACKEEGVDNIIATAWGDDGSEAPFSVVLFGLTLYSYLNFNSVYNETEFSEYLELHTQMNLLEWLKQGEFDYLCHFDTENYLDATPSKYYLYQDLLMPLFMTQISQLSVDYGQVMEELADHFATINKGCNLTNQFYYDFAKVLSTKWSLPLKIWEAYHNDDKKALELIINARLPELKQKLILLMDSRRKLWLHESHAMGFEILEQRFGGMIVRCDSVSERLQAYLEGEIDSIPELTEERLDPLPLENHNRLEAVHYNRALRIMSRSRATW